MSVVITVSPGSLPAGYNGVAYSQTVTASGGSAPYTYAVTSGSLPAGLTLNSGTGAITGTPTTASTYPFTITATDAGSHTGHTDYSVAITNDWSQYATNTLQFLAWWRYRETSGTNAANSGSLGSAADGTYLSATVGQTGQLGANEAFLADGSNTRVQTPNVVALASLTTFEYVFLVRPTSAGEGGFGVFAAWGNGGGDATKVYEFLFGGSLSVIDANMYNTADTLFQTISSAGLSVNTWALLFVSYDNAGDRKVHFYKGVGGAVSELTYTAQPAMTGTFRAPSQPLNIANRTNQGVTFAGLIDEAGIINRALTPAERLKTVQLIGV